MRELARALYEESFLPTMKACNNLWLAQFRIVNESQVKALTRMAVSFAADTAYIDSLRGKGEFDLEEPREISSGVLETNPPKLKQMEEILNVTFTNDQHILQWGYQDFQTKVSLD
jgi:hypothetical protein